MAVIDGGLERMVLANLLMEAATTTESGTILFLPLRHSLGAVPKIYHLVARVTTTIDSKHESPRVYDETELLLYMNLTIKSNT